jgi:hypothetical protein
MKSELAIITFNCYKEDKSLNSISKEDLKAIIDYSIQNIYGILEASKIMYSIDYDTAYKLKIPEK